MRIIFAWDWDNEIEQLVTWRDGFAGMLRELKKKCDVDVFTQIRGITEPTTIPHPYFNIRCFPDYISMQEEILKQKPDFVLFWADMTRPAIPKVAEAIPSGICFSGGEPITNLTHLFKVIFTESAVYNDRLLANGYNSVQAFGTNTEHFKPKKQPKIFEAFFPATFAEWKRHKLFAEATKGMRSFACGWKQQYDTDCFEVCEKSGVFTTGHMTASVLPDFYNASECVLVTSRSDGGSQRTVLEAMSCNVPVIVMSDSDKCTEYLNQAGYGSYIVEPIANVISERIHQIQVEQPEMNAREWVLKNYSEFTWADKVFTEIQKCLI